MTPRAKSSPQPEAATPADSGTARGRRLARGIVSSFASRGVAALVPLVMIPIMLPALGAPTYGSWMTIASITAMLIWADLGLGSGLLTRLSRHLANNDHLSGRRDILATYSIVGLVACVLSILTVVSPMFMSWPRLLNISESFSESVTSIAIVCLLCFFFNMPLSLIQRVQYASDQVNSSNLFTSTGPIISLALTLGATRAQLPAALIVGSATVGPLIANVGATIWFFGHNKFLIPRSSDRKGAEPLALLSLGGLYVLITMSSSLAINSDSLVIAHTLGPAEVAAFAVAARVMAAMGLLISLVNLPLWPAAANALARGDTAWVRRTTHRMTLVSVVFVGCSSLVIMIISEPLIAALSKGLVGRDLALLACLGVWWTVVALTSPLMMVQNAAGVLVPQLVGWVVFLLASLPLKVLAVSSLGLYAGPLVGAVSYSVVVLPSALWGYKRSMQLAERKKIDQVTSTVDI